MTLGNLFSLERRIAVVTGAAGHLGEAMVSALCEAGAIVYANGRDEAKIAALADKLGKAGHDVRPFCFDIEDDGAIREAIARLRDEAGRLDVLVNNAYGGTSGSIEAATRDEYLHAYNLAVASAAALVSASLDLLKLAATGTGSASIINIASMYGKVSPDFRIYRDGAPNPPIYGPAKAGLIQWTRYLACSLGPDRIRANSVSPGPFPSDATAAERPELVRDLASKNPLGRIGRPIDLAGAIVFLASDAAAYVTGIDLPVDGGWTAW